MSSQALKNLKETYECYKVCWITTLTLLGVYLIALLHFWADEFCKQCVLEMLSDKLKNPNAKAYINLNSTSEITTSYILVCYNTSIFCQYSFDFNVVEISQTAETGTKECISVSSYPNKERNTNNEWGLQLRCNIASIIWKRRREKE